MDIKCNFELFGLPASGKSTYAKTINSLNLNQKYLYHKNRFIRNLKKLKLLLLLIFTKNKLFFKSYHLLKNVKFKSLGKRIKMLVYLDTILCLSIIYKNKQYENYFFDEGLVQVLWGICYNSKYDSEFIKKYLKEFSEYLSDNIIIMDTDFALNKDRLLSRSEVGGDELSHDIKINSSAFERAIKIRDEIIQECILLKLKIKKINGGK